MQKLGTMLFSKAVNNTIVYSHRENQLKKKTIMNILFQITLCTHTLFECANIIRHKVPHIFRAAHWLLALNQDFLLLWLSDVVWFAMIFRLVRARHDNSSPSGYKFREIFTLIYIFTRARFRHEHNLWSTHETLALMIVLDLVFAFMWYTRRN